MIISNDVVLNRMNVDSAFSLCVMGLIQRKGERGTLLMNSKFESYFKNYCHPTHSTTYVIEGRLETGRELIVVKF